MASSIVGTWNTFVDWGDTGHAITAYPFTFNADGTWSYTFGGGRWVQQEGMAFLTFTNAAGLVYAANVTADTLAGIMGYASAPPNPGAGAWWATRTGAPHALASERAEESSEAEQDVAVAPPATQG
jgi:hypothetical protein